MQFIYPCVLLLLWFKDYVMCVCVCVCVCFLSEAVDKAPPMLQTSPAAKTYSRSAVAPRNGNVGPAPTFKSPGGQIRSSFQPGAPSGAVSKLRMGAVAYFGL